MVTLYGYTHKPYVSPAASKDEPLRTEVIPGQGAQPVGSRYLCGKRGRLVTVERRE